MKKFLPLTILALALSVSSVVDAKSIGRSGGGASISRSGTSSFSAAPAPRQAPPAAIGQRRQEVTNGVRQDVAAQRPVTPTQSAATGTTAAPSNYGSNYGSTYRPAQPTYQSPTYNAPAAPAATGVTNGSTFMSSLGGSLAGTVLGNMISGGHRDHTTVINNGGVGTVPAPHVSTGGGVVTDGGVVTGVSSAAGGATAVAVSKPYTMWSFIGDVITFAILIAVLAGLAWLAYKAFKMIRSYVRKEKAANVAAATPFSAMGSFWEIQRAFANTDTLKLQSLLGPDCVDELTNGLEPHELKLSGVSYEVRLQEETKISVWYSFTDDADNEEVNQVWHFDLINGKWMLQGLENV